LACQYIPSQDCYNSAFAPCHNTATFDHTPLVINFGDALGQIIPVERKEMKVTEVTNEEYDALCKDRNAQRGAGGFGSTDKK